MITAVIIDDELAYRKALRDNLAMYCPDVKLLGEANDISSGLQLIKKCNPGVVFLDIKLSESTTGFQLLEQIDSINFEVIFVTAFDDFALQAFRYSAVDYLTKPIKHKELQESVLRLQERNARYTNKKLDLLIANYKNNDIRKIGLPTISGIEFITIDNILRCEADRGYTQIHLDKQPLLLATKTLKDFEDILPPNIFVRVHRSHIININFMKRYDKNGYVIMEDGKSIEIPRRRREDFINFISQFHVG